MGKGVLWFYKEAFQMKKRMLIVYPLLLLALAGCDGASSSSTASTPNESVTSSNPDDTTSDGSETSVPDESTPDVPKPARSAFIKALTDSTENVTHFKRVFNSYDQAFDSDNMIIVGKFTVSSYVSDVSTYDNDTYKAVCESKIYTTPFDMLEAPTGKSMNVSNHDYYLQATDTKLTYIDDATIDTDRSINYCQYNVDLIHQYSSFKSAFTDFPKQNVSVYGDGKTYFDGLVSASPDYYSYDTTDPFVDNPVIANSDGSFTYSFSAHMFTCHYGDYYDVNRRFTYAVTIDADSNLLNYALSVESFDPVYDDNNVLTGYEVTSATTDTFSSLGNDSLGDYSTALPDMVSVGSDDDGNYLNAAGVKVQPMYVPHPSYDMSAISQDDLNDDDIINKLSASLPSYLTSCTGCTMDATLSDGDTGAVYQEHREKKLYTNDFVKMDGTLKQSPVTESEDEDTGETTYTYEEEEDVTYSTTLQVSSDKIAITHEETDSTVYFYQNPLNGIDEMGVFSFEGDFDVPSYLPMSVLDYLDPSMLTSALTLVSLDKEQCSVSDGVLTLQGTDYSSDYLITIKDNKITHVTETPTSINCEPYGANAKITKEYVLSEAAIADYQA